MKTLTVDRIEGIYTICADENNRYFAIQNSELPESLSVGDDILVDDESGTITLAETAAEKKQKSSAK